MYDSTLPSYRNSAAYGIRWVMRAWRMSHPDESVRSTRAFVRSLSATMGRVRLDASVVSQLESPTGAIAPLTVPRIEAYEEVLGCQRGSFVNLYLFLCRNRSTAPNLGRRLLGEGGAPQERQREASFYELAYRLAIGEASSVHEWQVLSLGVSKEGYVIGGSLADGLDARLADCLVKASGTDLRALREVAVQLGPTTVESFSSRLERHPVRAFHLLEPFAFSSFESVRPLLMRLVGGYEESWIIRAVLETYRLALARGEERADASHKAEAWNLVEHFISHPDWEVRAEAARLASDHPALQATTARLWVRKLVSGIDDRDTSRVIDRRLNNEERRVVQSLADAILDAPLPPKSWVADDLHDILRRSLFDAERIARIEAAWMLAASPYADQAGHHALQILIQGGYEEPTRRSLCRLVGRLRPDGAAEALMKIATNNDESESVVLTALWDTPSLAGPDSSAWLKQLFDDASDKGRTRVARGVTTAAGVLGLGGILRRAQSSPAIQVAEEARHWLRET